MNDETNLRDDISFLRQMAESGRQGPILGGIFLAAAGVVFGCASILSWASHAHLLPFPLVGDGPLWLIAGVVFVGLWLAIFFGIVRKSTTKPAANNAAFAAVWQGLALGVMTAFATTVFIAHQQKVDVVLSAYVPVIYAFYGTAWFSCAALAKRRWMYLAAFGCFVFAFVIAALTESNLQSLAMGIGLLLLLTLPGLRLMADEPR